MLFQFNDLLVENCVLHHFVAAKTALVVAMDITLHQKKCHDQTKHLDKGLLYVFAQNAESLRLVGWNDRQLELQFGFLFVRDPPPVDVVNTSQLLVWPEITGCKHQQMAIEWVLGKCISGGANIGNDVDHLHQHLRFRDGKSISGWDVCFSNPSQYVRSLIKYTFLKGIPARLENCQPDFWSEWKNTPNNHIGRRSEEGR